MHFGDRYKKKVRPKKRWMDGIKHDKLKNVKRLVEMIDIVLTPNKME